MHDSLLNFHNFFWDTLYIADGFLGGRIPCTSSEFPFLRRENELISDSHWTDYLWFYAPNKDKNAMFESAYEIVLTDAKCITKQHNCIVDKSLKIII
jgi:hypothetical protein